MMTLLTAIVGTMIVFAGIAFVGWVLWPKIGGFFRDSETYYLAFTQAVGGIVAVLIGGLQAMNWTPLLKDGLSWRQLVPLGGVLFVQGVATYLARKNRATDL